MKTLCKIGKRYCFFIVSLIFLLIIFMFNNKVAINSFNSAKYSMFQMLSVLPPIMILLGLMDVWIPKEVLIKYMGENSGALGVFLSIMIGSLAAGPMYAAFPFTIVLMKKGVKFRNIIIFMNAWCVTKVSTLLFEFSALGIKFTVARLFIDIPGVILMGYLVCYFINKDDLIKIYNHKQ